MVNIEKNRPPVVEYNSENKTIILRKEEDNSIVKAVKASDLRKKC